MDEAPIVEIGTWDPRGQWVTTALCGVLGLIVAAAAYAITNTEVNGVITNINKGLADNYESVK